MDLPKPTKESDPVASERTSGEEAKREMELYFQQLMDSSPHAIVVQSEGRIIFINANGTKLLGASNPDQLVGKPVLDFVTLMTGKP